MDAPDRPRSLRRQWTALLLAPVAWVAALGILFPLTHDACVRGSRTALWIITGACVVAALAGGALAWRERRIAAGHAIADRARFLMQVALGASALFLIVLLVMAVPVSMLGACRT
jgi:hypothetical protein